MGFGEHQHHYRILSSMVCELLGASPEAPHELIIQVDHCFIGLMSSVAGSTGGRMYAPKSW